jgi:hypothetical protein
VTVPANAVSTTTVADGLRVAQAMTVEGR